MRSFLRAKVKATIVAFKRLVDVCADDVVGIVLSVKFVDLIEVHENEYL
jgi:hypothetical protein